MSIQQLDLGHVCLFLPFLTVNTPASDHSSTSLSDNPGRHFIHQVAVLSCLQR